MICLHSTTTLRGNSNPRSDHGKAEEQTTASPHWSLGYEIVMEPSEVVSVEQGNSGDQGSLLWNIFVLWINKLGQIIGRVFAPDESECWIFIKKTFIILLTFANLLPLFTTVFFKFTIPPWYILKGLQYSWTLTPANSTQVGLPQTVFWLKQKVI